VSDQDARGPEPAPIFDALVRPPTLWGCDPRLFSILATVAGLGAYAAALRLSVGLGLASALIFVVGVLGLNELTKHDPYGFDVWLRSRGYAHEYDARARWDVAVRRRRGWR
jgi:type IV secretory pathway TrbD component